MTENLQSGNRRDDAAGNNVSRAGQPVQDGDGQQQFTPEELRKAARVQIILYVVMAVFIALPFIFMWLRKN